MPPAGLDQLARFFFRSEGRIGRLEYGLGAGFIVTIALAAISVMVARAEVSAGAFIVTAIIGLPFMAGLLVLVAKRCHDIGLPASFVLLVAVPVVDLVWLAALAWLPGDSRPNLYGPPPRFRAD